MKTKSKQEKKAIAIDVFGRYNKAQKVAVTSDGMAFIVDNSENAVKNHAKKNRYKKELTITYFTRDEVESNDTPEKPKTAKELIETIETATEIDVVNEILEAETNGDKRKTVMEAAVKRLEELKQPE